MLHRLYRIYRFIDLFIQIYNDLDYRSSIHILVRVIR